MVRLTKTTYSPAVALFRRRREEDRTLPRATIPPAYWQDTTTPVVSVREGLRIADVFACIRALADTAASLPLVAYRRTEQARVRAGGRVQELVDAPAPATTTAAFVGQLVCHLNLWGNAYVGKYRDEEGRVAVLGLLAPESVIVEVERGRPVYTVYSLEGISRHTSDDILHIRAIVSEDGITGLSPIRQCAGALALNDQLARHARDTMLRGARLSGILSTPADAVVDPNNIETIRQEIQGSWVGPDASGSIAFVTGGLSFSPVSLPMDDLQFIEQRQLSAQEIARIFRVPPWMIGAPSSDSMTYSNVESQAQGFVTFSLRPWLVAIEQAVSADRDLMPSTTFVEFLVDGLLRGDSATRSEVYTRALDQETGWMTREEVRRLENLAPEEGT
jgi:HK97 family phage portal protein